MKGGSSGNNKEDNNVLQPHHKLSILLSFHKDFSKVMTLSSLIEDICSINPIFKKNVLNMGNLIDINNKDHINIKTKNDFLSFCSKTIICFSQKENISFDYFLNQIQNINIIEVNNEVKILNLLADSSTFFHKEIFNNYIQFAGLKSSFNILEDNFILLKNFSNRLINTKNFERLRLMLGDWIILYIFKYCSMFIFDEICQNYIQVLGTNFKSIMTKLIAVPRIEKTGNNNFYFTKVFSGNSTFYTQSQFQNKAFPFLNDNSYTVERTKIYYCSNFNRKLGFFKNLKIIPLTNFKNVISTLEKMWMNSANSNNNFMYKKNKNNNDKNKMNSKNELNYNSYNFTKSINTTEINNNFVSVTYNKLFSKVNSLLPIEVKSKIYFFFNHIALRINAYNYPKELFNACPIMKDWQKIKLSIKQKLKEIENAKWRN